MPDPDEPQPISPSASPAHAESGPAVPSAGLPDPITKTAVLAALRALESQLYSAEAVAKVKEQPPAQQLEFAQSRLHLTATINKINAALMGDIRAKLQAQAASLDVGIGAVSASLDRLEGAAGWAQAVDGVIRLLGKVVSLL